jgi:hypothetical protein
MYGYLLVLVILIIAVWAYTNKNTENITDNTNNNRWEVNFYGNPIYHDYSNSDQTVWVAARSGRSYAGSCRSIAPQKDSTRATDFNNEGTNITIINNGTFYRIYQAGLAKYKGQWRIIGEYRDPANPVVINCTYLFPVIAPASFVRDLLGNNYEACNTKTYNQAIYDNYYNNYYHVDSYAFLNYLHQTAPEMTDADVAAMIGTYNTLRSTGKIDGTLTSSYRIVPSSTLSPVFTHFCKRVGVVPNEQAMALFYCVNPIYKAAGNVMYYYRSGIADNDISPPRYVNLGECAIQINLNFVQMFPSYAAIDDKKAWAYAYLMYGPATNPPADFITMLCNVVNLGGIDAAYLLGRDEDKDKYYWYLYDSPAYGSGWVWKQLRANYVSNLQQINSNWPIERNTRLLSKSQSGTLGLGECMVGFLSKNPDLCATYGITVGGKFDSNWTWVHPRMSMTRSDYQREITPIGQSPGSNHQYRLPAGVTNGMNVRDPTTGGIYLVEKNMLRNYPDWPTYVSWYTPSYSTINHSDVVGKSLSSTSYQAGAYIGPPMARNPFPPGITNGMNVAADGAGIWHLMYDQRMWFPNWAIYSSWGTPAYVKISASALNAIPRGPDVVAKKYSWQTL